MLIYSLILSVVTCVLSLIMASDFITFGTGLLMIIGVLFGSMATTSLAEIFRKRYRELIPNNSILRGFIDYGLSASSVFFPLMINLFIAGLSEMGMMMAVFGGDNTVMVLIQIVWIAISVVLGTTFTLVAYPKSEFNTVITMTDKMKNQIKDKVNKVTEIKKNCIHCNSEIEKAAKFCPYCGKENN